MSNKSSNETSNSISKPTQQPDVSPQILIQLVSELRKYVSSNKPDVSCNKSEEQQNSDSGKAGDGRASVQGSSWCICVPKHGKAKKEETGVEKSPGEGSKPKKSPEIMIKKLESNLEQMESDLTKLKGNEEHFKREIESHTDQIKELFKNIKEARSSQLNGDGQNESSIAHKLWEINKKIIKLKHRIPSTSATTGAADRRDESPKTEAAGTQIAVDELLRLYTSTSFTESSLYNEIKNVYDYELDEKEKNCLLCFAVFTENEELTKRMLTYWWAGEAYIIENKQDKKTIEELAEKILEKFVGKHLIEPVYKKRWPTAKSYKMQPIIRSVIVKLAIEKNYFAYDDNGNLKARSPESKKVCLVKKFENKNKIDEKNHALSSDSQAQTLPKSEDPKVEKNPAPSSDSQAQAPPKSEDPKVEQNPALSSDSQAQAPPKSEDPKVEKSPAPSSDSQAQAPPKSEDSKDEQNPALSSDSQAQAPPKSEDQYPKGWETKRKTIFNVDEPFPDLRLNWLAKGRDKNRNTEEEKRLEVVEWLSKMKDLKVLYLGTWRASGNKHHIEVDSPDFLKALWSMSSLRLLSLQGISRIIKLTDSIKGLTSLTILDLKACHNMEELPKEISYLKSLTHLDVSDCYMIDHMPRELRHLTNLQVLKGFVVGKDKHLSGKFCAFDDLARMKNLTKLSIFISRKDFPSGKDFQTFESLDGLKKLSLSWGADNETKGTSSSTTSPSGEKKWTKCFDIWGRSTPSGEKKSIEEKLSKNLEKLDLQCYPHESTPSWLVPGKLANLKKLYIRGGKLGGDLGYSSFKNGNESTMIAWKFVETLRLKFLAGLKLDWEEMEEFFPKLSYLEKIDCPLVTMCPCDADGVWVKPPKLPSSHNQSDHEQEIQEQDGNQEPQQSK
ncbi:uncharacterized protein LOC133778113 [Humulus lupulus]|uniref:uncharacterized protein LOC133778113 n=1 Tax=Humulus lupulus TaxID=3486 RepID=UPI002B4050D9|nr:uncharacterized protein LOC133778113 [Humulus lupulus]